MDKQLQSRKNEHLEICRDEAIEVPVADGPRGLGHFTLEYDALPEIDLDEVDLQTPILGRQLMAPLVVGAMTGGTERARQINIRLARAAARVGVGMALGSQRAMIARSELSSTYQVRQEAPELPLLLGNIGAVQLRCGTSAVDIAGALSAVSADAVMFHLNPLQEAIQPEGDTLFGGLQRRLAETIPQLDVPALAKEVGAGISSSAARKLATLPLAGVETAGVGGTCWARVESRRALAGSAASIVGQRLGGWGIPTAASIRVCRQFFGEQRVVIGSGGIRSGFDIAVALALGADAVAIARPLLLAAEQSEQAVVDALQALLLELRVICFCTGVRRPRQLREVRVLPAAEPLDKHIECLLAPEPR